MLQFIYKTLCAVWINTNRILSVNAKTTGKNKAILRMHMSQDQINKSVQFLNQLNLNK